MANSRSKQVAGMRPAQSALDSSALVHVIGEYLTKTGDVVNDIVEMGAIPAGFVPVDLVIDNGALGAGATLEAGILKGTRLVARPLLMMGQTGPAMTGFGSRVCTLAMSRRSLLGSMIKR